MENDRQLIENYLKGDEKSLEILIGRHLKPIYNFAYKYAGNPQEAEDITQEVFVKVWKNLKKFDKQKNFKNWIFPIAKNTAIDFLKKKKAMQFSDFENEKGENILAETIIDSSLLPVELLERKDMLGMLMKAMNKLLPKYRKVLLLRHNDDLTFREISRITGEPLNTVKSRHRRALMMLKKLLARFY
jgi:RNA polymerase sigma-70 factor (ECF subfamily)